MTYKSKISKYKNKLIVILPKEVVRALNIKIGEKYDSKLMSDGKIIFQFLRGISAS